jgi:hypothetical protein
MLGLGHRPGGIMKPIFTSHGLRLAAVGWLGFAQEDGQRAPRGRQRLPKMSGPPERRIKLMASRGIASE